jgi:HEAT repeat protein
VGPLQTAAFLAFAGGVGAWLSLLALLVLDRAGFERRGRRPRPLRRGTWARVEALDHAPLPALARALRSDEPEVVAGAVARLGRLADPLAASLLVDALVRERLPRSRIAAHLDAFQLPIAHLLVPLVADDRPGVRFWAVTLLAGHTAEPGASAALLHAATDEDPNVRAAAAEALAGAGVAAVPALLTLLGDPEWYVRAHAARSVGALGRPRLARHVAPLLADRSWWTRAAAKEALERIGDAASDTVIAFLDHEDRFARNGAAEVLQNTGVLERLAVAAREVPDGLEARLLERAFRAGGDRLARAAEHRAARLSLPTAAPDERQVA